MKDIDIFKKYVSNYDLNDFNLEKKFYHSIRVRNNSETIARSLNLTEKDVKLVSFIGLFHDIGRFPQWKVYHTFDDAISIDHALLSVKVLFDTSSQNIFEISSSDADIIRKAIYNHNKYVIDNHLNEKEKLFAKIIRDADKLDLLYLLGEQDLVLEEDNSEVTDVIHENYWHNQSLKTSKCQTLSDKILFKMAFVFDLNFSKSFEIVDKENMLDNFYNNLKYKERYEKYYWHAKEYVNSKKISD